jgi:hypothetical protein
MHKNRNEPVCAHRYFSHWSKVKTRVVLKQKTLQGKPAGFLKDLYKDQDNLFTILVRDDFWFAAFFQWMMFFLASLSSIAVTSFRSA